MGNSTRHMKHLMAGCLSLTVGFTGIAPAFLDPIVGVSAAEAAADGMVNITQTGPGAHRALKLGLKKAIVIDLPVDAHDILVSDPSMADAVTRSSRRIYLFGKTVGQTNIFIFGA